MRPGAGTTKGHEMILTLADLRRRNHALQIVRNYDESLRSGRVLTASDMRRRSIAKRILRSYEENAGR